MVRMLREELYSITQLRITYYYYRAVVLNPGVMNSRGGHFDFIGGHRGFEKYG